MNDVTGTWMRWRENVTEEDLSAELSAMEKNPEEREDAFYRDLAFGTGGLRGILGAGTNRMNEYIVARASQGLANYIRKNFSPDARSIAVSHDSRIKSDVFARVCAEVFAAAGITVHLYPRLMPTPCLSYAVRYFHCAGGVMVTASHNPSRYNGYKVYGPDGCQITTQAAAAILEEIDALDVFDDVRRMPFEEGVKAGRICLIGEEVLSSYLAEVKAQSPERDDPALPRDIPIVYTPLNGAGREPVLRILKESGYSRVKCVAEQEMPDGTFPTCPYPNPEIAQAMELGLSYARAEQAELLLGTDPDCDRVGVAVRTPAGEYTLLSGNEVGLLLFDYLCARRSAKGQMPDHPLVLKTIVTTDLAERIAEHYGVRCFNVLTGFKYIGEQIGLLEAAGRAGDYLFGFEESCGYLSGSYVRDKDGVDGAFLVCEMFCYWRAQGISLYEKLEELYAAYGYCLNTLHSYTYEGEAGFAAMQEKMAVLHEAADGVKEGRALAFGPKEVTEVLDYSAGLDGLPPSDVLKFRLSGHSSAVVRPSGTEPKLKAYISVNAPDRETAAAWEKEIAADLEKYL